MGQDLNSGPRSGKFETVYIDNHGFHPHDDARLWEENRGKLRIDAISPLAPLAMVCINCTRNPGLLLSIGIQASPNRVPSARSVSSLCVLFKVIVCLYSRSAFEFVRRVLAFISKFLVIYFEI